MNETAIRRRAQQYGYFGLLPFLAPAALVWILPEERAIASTHFFVTYSAVILSFLSGLLWAPAIFRANSEQANEHMLTAAIFVSLLSWVCLLLPALYASWVLLTGFNLIRRIEIAITDQAYMPWYSELRDRLTRVVTGCHLSVGVYLIIV